MHCFSPLPQRDLDRRFHRSVDSDFGRRSQWAFSHQHRKLKSSWEADYKAWGQRDLSQKRYVYWWADGVYFNVQLDEEQTCVLALIGATEDGTKELLAVVDGYRESTQSWRELLGQLKRLGLSAAPKLAIGDGSLVSGSLCRKNMARSPSNVAGCIRQPTSWIKCPRAFRAKLSN